MQTYVLILLSILVVLLIGVIYFGWRKIINLEIENSRNKYDIEALRNLLSRIFDGEDVIPAPPKTQSKQMQNAFNLESMQFPTQVNVPNFLQQEKSSKLEKNLRREEIEEESDVETLESTDDNLPKKLDEESSVTVESLENSSDEETETQEESEEEETETSGSQSDEDSDDEAQKIIENELELDEKTESVNEENVENLVHGDEPEEDKTEEVVPVSENNHSEDEKNEDSKQDEEETKHDEEESKTDLKKKKLLPNEPARNFKAGYKIKSTNDGKMYEVVQNGKRKSWKLIN